MNGSAAITRHSDSTAQAAGSPPKAGVVEVLGWTVAVILASIFVPPAGPVAAIALAFTRLRQNRVARVVLIVISTALLIGWIGLFDGWNSGIVGPPSNA